MRKQRFVWKRLVVFAMVAVLILSISAPCAAQAADSKKEIFLGYPKTTWGAKTSSLKAEEQRQYEVKEMFLDVGDEVSICYLNGHKSPSGKKWKSSNEKVAKVDNAGHITATGKGVTTISVSYKKWFTSYSASVKVYVGEENWGLQIGFIPSIGAKQIELKKGSEIAPDVCSREDILNRTDTLYWVTWKTDDTKVAEMKDGVLKAKNTGKTRLTATITNEITQKIHKVSTSIVITDPVYTKDEVSWNNEFYRMYGENYKQLFTDDVWFSLNYTRELDLMDEANRVVNNQVKKIGLSAAATLSDVSKSMSLSFSSLFGGKDMNSEIHEDAVMYLVRELAKEDSLQRTKSVEKAEKTLADFGEITHALEDLSGNDASLWAMSLLFENIPLYELKAILDDTQKTLGVVNKVIDAGVDAKKYLAGTLCVYETENQILNDLQSSTSVESALYRDIEAVKREREKNPGAYFMQKYITPIAAKSVTKMLIKLAGGTASAVAEAAKQAVNTIAAVAGADDLKKVAEAAHLMNYLFFSRDRASQLRTEIKENYAYYSEQELIEKIEQYEKNYTMFLAMVNPILSKISALKGATHEILEDARIPNEKYDYAKHIAVAMSGLYMMNQDIPERKVVEAPVVAPVEQPVMTPTEIPVVTPVEQPVMTPIEIPVVTPVEQPAAIPTETPVAPPVVQPNESQTSDIRSADGRITVQAKLDQMLSKLGYGNGTPVYFTTKQQGCTGVGANGYHEQCDFCLASNIIAMQWFRDTFGTISNLSNLPRHNYNATGSNYNGWACFGFACVAQYYVFADSFSQSLTGQLVANTKFSRNNVQGVVQPGDVLRIGSHSMVVYEVQEDGVMVVDCNSEYDKGLNCSVQKHLRTWEPNRTVLVCRVKEASSYGSGFAGLYDVKAGEPIANVQPVETQQTTETPEVSEKRQYGVLTNCIAYNVGIREDMYADKAYRIENGATLEILDFIERNSKGNPVYYVYSKDLGMNCYVSKKFVKIIE